MSRVIVNAGTGDVRHVGPCRLAWATSNMYRLVGDLNPCLGLLSWRPVGVSDWDDGGRWTFRIERGRRKVIVDMPGCALRRVRFRHDEPWPRPVPPRLYVDGHSYWWPFAVEAVQDALVGLR